MDQPTDTLFDSCNSAKILKEYIPRNLTIEFLGNKYTFENLACFEPKKSTLQQNFLIFSLLCHVLHLFNSDVVCPMYRNFNLYFFSL